MGGVERWICPGNFLGTSANQGEDRGALLGCTGWYTGYLWAVLGSGQHMGAQLGTSPGALGHLVYFPSASATMLRKSNISPSPSPESS